MDITFENVKSFSTRNGAVTIQDVEEEALKYICVTSLRKIGYDVKLTRTYHTCPVCKSQSRLILETRHSGYGDKAEVYYIECINKEKCGLRTQDCWTKLDAEIDWEDICSHGKE